MSTNISNKEWKEYKQNFIDIIHNDAALACNNGHTPYLWDTLEMAVKIKNNMQKTNDDSKFSIDLDPCIYLSAKLKLIKDNNIINLLQNFYKYNECDYNYILYDKKIIDWCNERHRSYIDVINILLCENDENYYNLFKMPLDLLYSRGDKMRFAKINNNNEIYYENPDKISQLELEKEQKERLQRILGDISNV